MIPEPIRQVREFIDTDGNNNELITYMVDNRLLHRVDGPSCISVLNGDVELEVYYQGRNKHRDDGPAVIRYDSERVVSQLYYKHNVCLFDALTASGYFETNDQEIKEFIIGML